MLSLYKENRLLKKNCQSQPRRENGTIEILYRLYQHFTNVTLSHLYLTSIMPLQSNSPRYPSVFRLTAQHPGRLRVSATQPVAMRQSARQILCSSPEVVPRNRILPRRKIWKSKEKFADTAESQAGTRVQLARRFDLERSRFARVPELVPRGRITARLCVCTEHIAFSFFFFFSTDKKNFLCGQR